MPLPLKEHLRALYAQALVGFGAVARARRRNRDAALVLMYHRVLNDEEVPPDIDPGMYVTRSAFERHLRYLREHHDVIDLDQLFAWLRGTLTTTRSPCVITFDDGWADNFTVAYPLLRQYGLPASIFLISEKVGDPALLTWEQVHEMRQHGVSFGSHTATHPVLTEIGDAAVVEELTLSKARLERELGTPCRWVCYPKGRFDERSLAAARQLYVGALSTIEGPVAKDSDLHRIPRIGVHHDVTRTTALFACRLASLV
ncbi:MAG: polysaccharide deacetylase family protein [Vicinamibacterales bacterium]